MKEKLSIVKDLEDFFSLKVIGSYLFVIDNLLHIHEINDIDLLVDKAKTSNVRKYLISIGYVETKVPYSRPGYEFIQGSLKFKKDGEIDIHLCESEGAVGIHSIPDLIRAKFKRGTKEDYHQLSLVMNSKVAN